MAQHSLHDRMDRIRNIIGAPRLTTGQRRVLLALLTRMPLDDLNAGWLLTTRQIAQDAFGGTANSARAMTRKALKELEDMGLIERVWAGSKADHNEAATYFVNWPDSDLAEPSAEIMQLPIAR
jgi:hypothetical protein